MECIRNGPPPPAPELVQIELTGWVRIQRTDVIRIRLIAMLMGAKMQRLEVVRRHSEFLSHFFRTQANPT